MIHEKDTAPHPPYVEVTKRKPQPERDICDYPGCTVDAVAKFNVNVASTVRCMCHSNAHIVQTLACQQHVSLLDLIEGGFKDA